MSTTTSFDPRTTELCTFTVGNLLFGIPTIRVQEVLQAQPITHVPMTSPIVRGLINLRGQIVTTIDVARICGLQDTNAAEGWTNVVVTTPSNPVSLLVDGIGDVLRVTAETFETAPATLHAEAQRYVAGTHKLESGLLLVFDLDAVVGVPLLDLEPQTTARRSVIHLSN
jgi:purine-binding chemotaxis protein CheW